MKWYAAAVTTSLALAGAANASPLSGQTVLKGAMDMAVGGDAPVHAAASWDWYDCGAPSDVVHIKSLKVEPDPPEPGHNLTIYASGTADKRVDEGSYADVVVKLGLIKLLTKRFDLCEELANADADIQCPIEPGKHSIVQTVALPREIPRAKFQVSARAFTQDDEPLACVDLSISFLP